MWKLTLETARIRSKLLSSKLKLKKPESDHADDSKSVKPRTLSNFECLRNLFV